MVKASMDFRLKAVVLYSQGVKTASEVRSLFNVPERTLRRWAKAYQLAGIKGLELQPTVPKKPCNQTPLRVVQRVLALKKKYPAWGARRLKFQFSIPLHYTTVHDILKEKDMLIKIKAKPQPCGLDCPRWRNSRRDN